MAALRASFVVLLLSVGSAWACYPDVNLALCWDLQEGKGTTIHDNTVNQTTASIMGTAAWVGSPKPRGLIFTNNSGSNTFANTGDWMVSFPGIAGSDIRSTPLQKFNFTTALPFEFGITAQLNSLRDGNDKQLVGCAQIGSGWEFYFDNATDGVNFRILGVAGNDFLYPVTDTNPHRYFFARNSSKDMYLFVDGKMVATSFTNSGSIGFASADPLTIAGTTGGLSAFNGKANRLAIYTFDFVGKSLETLKAFAKNEYLYWQGLDNGSGVGE